MDDLPDYEFRRTVSEPSAPTRAAWRPTPLWVIVAALVASGAAYFAFVWGPRRAPTQVAGSSPKTSSLSPSGGTQELDGVAGIQLHPGGNFCA